MRWIATFVLVSLLLLFLVGLLVGYSPRFVTVGFAVLALLALGFSAVVLFATRRARLSQLGTREALSVAAMVKEGITDPWVANEAVALWHDVAQILSLPPERLRPTDRFTVELRPVPGWGYFDDRLEDLFHWSATRMDRDRAMHILRNGSLSDLLTALLAAQPSRMGR